MNFTIERSTLLAALTRLNGVVNRRNIIPILASVRIDADETGVTFRTTNLDIEATVTVGASVSAPGSICAPADKLMEIAKNAADGADIHFELKDKLIVKSGRSRFSLSALSATDFPTFNTFDHDVTFTLTGVELAALIGRVAFAQSSNASHFILTGVHFFCDNGMLGATATNTHRLALAERAFDARNFAVTIPALAVSEMIKAIDGSADQVTISISGEKIQLSAAGFQLTSKLLDGNYVKFRNIVPAETRNIVTVDQEAFVSSIRRAMIASDDAATSVKLSIADGVVKISARGQDVDAADEVETSYDGPEIALAINATDMLLALGAIGSETIEIAFSENCKDPFIIRSTVADELIVVMISLRG